MNLIASILLSGWFQLTILSVIFFVFSSRVLARNFVRGYALGWMFGLFFIFTYASLNPLQILQIGAYDYRLNILQVFAVSAFAMFISIGMSLVAYTLKDNLRWKAIQTSIITAILVIAIFLQIIAEPEIRLMVSLFILAFGMASLAGTILMSRRYDPRPPINNNPNVPYMGYGQGGGVQQPASRLDAIRNRIAQRINRNNVPTNLPPESNHR